MNPQTPEIVAFGEYLAPLNLLPLLHLAFTWLRTQTSISKQTMHTRHLGVWWTLLSVRREREISIRTNYSTQKLIKKMVINIKA